MSNHTKKIFRIQIMYSTDFSDSSPDHLGTPTTLQVEPTGNDKMKKTDSTQVASCCETEERLNGCLCRISEVH